MPLGRRLSSPIATSAVVAVLASTAMLGRAVEPVFAPITPVEPTPVEAASEEIERLRREVAEASLLKAEVESLRAQLESIEGRLPPIFPGASEQQTGVASAVVETVDPSEPYVPFAESPWSMSPRGRGSDLIGSYDYNFGGGLLQLQRRDEQFTFQIQNQLTLDGTFYSLEDPNTFEKNFNIPFYRLYFMGNFLEKWEYLASVQQSLGSFNILDMYLGYLLADEVNIRVGHYLSPFLYEYWAFSPAWEPVITNSPLFQLAGKRQTGAMLWGRLFDDVVQYQVGAFNGPTGAYFDLDRHLDTIAEVSWTPFKPSKGSLLESFGMGFSIQNGIQDYLLSDGAAYNFPSANGEPTLNQSFVNSSGVPFFTYADDVAADGNRYKIAPHLFYFGRFSVLGEYVHWNRALTNGATNITEQIDAYYVNTSYFLTGERYTGDGLLGYTTIEPLHRYGAWELVAQFSQLELGDESLTPGFAEPGQDATRLQQLMAGVNWWPNRYVRISFDYVNAWTNRAVDVGAGQFADTYGIWWGRAAAFF